MDVLETLLHYWPILWTIVGGLGGWCIRALRDYHAKDKADHESIALLTTSVDEIRADLNAIKAGNVAEYQESIATAHIRYCVNGEPLTIASRGRVNAMMRSLAALDDEDGTYQTMTNEINALPIFHPTDGEGGNRAH